MRRPQVPKRCIKLTRPAAQHPKHRIQSDAVTAILKCALAVFAGFRDATGAGQADCLADRGCSPVVDRGNGIHDNFLEQLPAAAIPAAWIRKGRRVMRPTAPIFSLRFPR